MSETRFRPQLAALILVVAPLLDVSACAFSDLTDYEIASCDPSAIDLEHDVCNRLNAGLPPDACSVWQCDAATSRCVQRAKDFDRDGDPAIACGGHDCDDRSRTVVSAGKEVCDGVDNDCDGLVDEDVFGAAAAPADLFKVEQASPTSDPSISGPVGGEALAAGDSTRAWAGAYVGAASPSGSCLKTSPLSAKDPPAGCAFLGDETTLQPREPVVRNFGVGQGVVFVATNLCPAGALHYRYAAPGQPVGTASVACKQSPAGQGAALPNVEFFKDGSLAVVAYYDEPLPDLGSSSACQTIAAAPAPLDVIAVASPTDKPAIQLIDGLPLILSAAASSRARPALARIDVDAPNEGGILVGSPDGAGASLWLISKTAEGAGFRLSPSSATSIPGMNDARSVSLGALKKETETLLAAVSDIGCSAQTIRVSFGTLAMQNGKLTTAMKPAVDVASGGTGRFSPVVRWVTIDKGSFWLVAWIEPGGQVMARRYAADGTAIGGPFHLASGAAVIDLAFDGRLYFFAPAGGVNSSAFQSVPVGCLPN